MKSIEMIKRTIEGQHIEKPMWLSYLMDSEEIHLNYENISSIENLSTEGVLKYVLRSLEILESMDVKEDTYHLLDSVLVHSELAKSGSLKQRKKWMKKGYNLMAHNEGSALIFDELTRYENPRKKELVHELIRTHGLVGQFIRGESRLDNHIKLVGLMEEFYSVEEAKEILILLNRCVIGAVSLELWNNVASEVETIIEKIFNRDFTVLFENRIQKLVPNRKETIEDMERIMGTKKEKVANLFLNVDLWYLEPATHDFSFEDVWTIFLMIDEKLKVKGMEHLNFEKFMKQMHYDFKGVKRNNVFRKRVIEKYLREYRETNNPETTHLSFKVEVDALIKTAFVSFEFSGVGEALINFCVEAEKTDMLHNKATIMLFDFFGLRKDAFDRFHNEETYLSHMNSSADDKRVILDYIKGETIIDVGPGGGVMLDMIEDETEDKKIYGIDISENVIETLKKKKMKESRNWDVVKGDAMNMSQTFGENSVDTIIYSSIIHELFSYIEWEGKKFNHDVVGAALKSAYNSLKPGGRIIIRDGIMSDNKDEKRVIRFKDTEGMDFLKQYTREFKGRPVQYDILSENEVKMPINDAMEFLYTFTWGPDSFPHEVQEQFGVFTPNEYKRFVNDLFGNRIKIIQSLNYLQEGYIVHLKDKIDFEDESGRAIHLPDSTFLLVLEKTI